MLWIAVAMLALVVILNWTWGRLPGEPERTGRLVRLGDTTVRVVERPGTGPAVVFIHGLPGTAEDFEAVAARLPGRRTITFDRPGFGFSSGDYHPFSEQLETIRRLIERLGLGRVVLAGHSYGGTIALAYAKRRPQDVRGLVLVDAAVAGQRSDWLNRAQSRLVQALSLPVVQPLADATFSQLLRTASAKAGDAQAFDPGDVDPEHEERLLALSMQHDDLDAYADEQLRADDVIADLDAELSSIDTPAVVIHGDGDKLVEPEHGRRLATLLPHARLEMVSGGHMAPYQHPGVVASAVRELLATRPAARRGPEPARSAAR